MEFHRREGVVEGANHPKVPHPPQINRFSTLKWASFFLGVQVLSSTAGEFRPKKTFLLIDFDVFLPS